MPAVIVTTSVAPPSAVNVILKVSPSAAEPVIVAEDVAATASTAVYVSSSVAPPSAVKVTLKVSFLAASEPEIVAEDVAATAWPEPVFAPTEIAKSTPSLRVTSNLSPLALNV